MQAVKSIILSAGRACFVCCKGCYNFFGKNKDLTPTSTIIDFLKKIDGIQKITVGGGDQLSRPDIIQLLSKIKKLGYRIYLDTVGTSFLSDANTVFHSNGNVSYIDPIKIKPYVDLIGIPLDGSNNEIMTKFRTGRPKIFSEQIKILSLLNQHNMPLCVNTVVTKDNFDDLYNIYTIIKKYHSIEEWQLFQFMPIGPLGYKNRKDYIIGDKEFQSCINDLLKKMGHTSIKITAKSRIKRKGKYLLIDTDGDCWYPSVSQLSKWNVDSDENAERVICGNINAIKDHTKIIDYIKGK